MEKTRKYTLTFFGAAVISMIINLIAATSAGKIAYYIALIAALAYLGFAIIAFIYSIVLIKKKDLPYGITILILSALLILIFVTGFIAGMAK